MITDRINNNLTALFNPDDDPVFKALICDKDGTIPVLINKPTDIDIGVTASQIEYLRKLSIGLLEQIYPDLMTSDFLTYLLNNFFESLQLTNESDADWLQRVINLVFSQKVSNAAIIFSMRPYSPGGEPVVTIDITDSAHADFSYCDIYTSGSYTAPAGTVYYYLAAIAEEGDFDVFTIKVTLYGTPSADIFSALEFLRKIVAAGISVIFEIIY